MNAIPKASMVIPIVAWLACITAPSAVLAGTQLLVDSAPPPPRIENVPHRDGFIWASGHWEWSGHSWSWVDGSYQYDQRHAHWIPDGWQPEGTQWRYVPGHWQR